MINLSWPVYRAAPVTQGYGENPGSGYACMPDGSHNGVDFGIPQGTAIYATANGTVTRADMDNTGYGLHVRIQHDGFLSLYGHMRSFAVKAGDKVKTGQVIGESGNTGNSTGPHLHFEIRKVADNCKSTIDPLHYLQTSAKYFGVVTEEGDGLRVRTKPDVAGEVKQYLSAGTKLAFADIFGDWGRLQDAGERWVCLRLKGVDYVKIDGAAQPKPEEPLTWQEAVDAFLRKLGYDGPKPS